MSIDKAMIDHHPIFNPLEFHIDTPMIDELQAAITQWLWCGATGGYIVGHSRAGKSRAIRRAIEHLTTRSGQPIPAFYLDLHMRDRPTVASVFRLLQRALGLTIKTRAIADDMSGDVLHHFAEAAFANHQRYVILVVDEVQRATLAQLCAFSELYDILLRMQTNLFVLFVANVGESDALFKRLAQPENEHIRGRFFINGYYYYGLRKLQDVTVCLQQYDELRYPHDGGPTVTEVFLPTLYADGWRLQTLSRTLWRVYQEQFQRPLKLDSWGMQFFTAAVKTLLVDYLPTYGVDNTDDVEMMIQKSIEASGLVPSAVAFT